MDDKINRIDYEKPEIIQELDLEVKAGSPPGFPEFSIDTFGEDIR